MTTPPPTPVGVAVDRTLVDLDGETPRLVGSACELCQLVMYPGDDLCPGCLGPARPRALSASGTLYSFSVVHIGPPERAVPYTVGYVDLPEGARLFAHLETPDADQLACDIPVALRLVPHGDAYCARWLAQAGADA